MRLVWIEKEREQKTETHAYTDLSNKKIEYGKERDTKRISNHAFSSRPFYRSHRHCSSLLPVSRLSLYHVPLFYFLSYFFCSSFAPFFCYRGISKLSCYPFVHCHKPISKTVSGRYRTAVAKSHLQGQNVLVFFPSHCLCSCGLFLCCLSYNFLLYFSVDLYLCTSVFLYLCISVVSLGTVCLCLSLSHALSFLCASLCLCLHL